MKKLVFALALAALPATSFAAGIDVSWDDCFDPAGTPSNSKVFNCAANANYNMHFQFKLPTPLPTFVSATAFNDYQNATGTPLTPFWRYEGGGCQLAPTVKGMVLSDDNQAAAVPAGCQSEANGGGPGRDDPWGNDGSGGTEAINAYGVDFHRPGNGYLILLDYRADGQGFPLTAGNNYWLFRLNWRTANRTACPGCADPGIFLFQRLFLEQSGADPSLNLDNPDKGGNCVSINNGPPTLCGVVPVRNTSWGQLKSLYR